MTTGKTDLRKLFRERRKEIPAADFARMVEEIRQRVLADARIRDADSIFSYISFGREAGTRQLLNELLLLGKTVIAPCADPAADPYRWFHILRPDDPLLRLKGEEPDSTPDISDAVDLPRVDVFLVPGLVWDAQGYRVGYGGGFFDRLLGKSGPHSVKMGLAFELQLVDKVPRDSWDVPVDVIVTEQRTIESG
jgi:5-formyltetrahydrofolate cyclo-ligase